MTTATMKQRQSVLLLVAIFVIAMIATTQSFLSKDIYEESQHQQMQQQQPYCSNNMHNLVDLLKENPEQNGLSDITYNNKTNTTTTSIIPGISKSLIEETIIGQRIAIFGDSTLRNYYKWLYWLLDLYSSHDDIDSPLWTQSNTTTTTAAAAVAITLQEGNTIIENHASRICRQRMKTISSKGPLCALPTQHGNALPIPTNLITTDTSGMKTTTYIEFVGTPAGLYYNQTEMIQEAWTSVQERIQPTILVANMALHILHYTRYRNTPPDRVLFWI
jgi:hypothetical protein